MVADAERERLAKRIQIVPGEATCLLNGMSGGRKVQEMRLIVLDSMGLYLIPQSNWQDLCVYSL